jgi:hypothetical protein
MIGNDKMMLPSAKVSQKFSQSKADRGLLSPPRNNGLPGPGDYSDDRLSPCEIRNEMAY